LSFCVDGEFQTRAVLADLFPVAEDRPIVSWTACLEVVSCCSAVVAGICGTCCVCWVAGGECLSCDEGQNCKECCSGEEHDLILKGRKRVECD
jgi:hypothetical protein